MVESGAKLASKRSHRQRAHLVVCSMRTFAAELVAEGFEVDYRSSASLAAGLVAHRADYAPSRVVACDAAEAAFRRGDVPIASAEGFIRQVIGWREYVWGRYWQWMPDHRGANDLGAHRALPPLFSGAPTRLRCVGQVIDDVGAHGYAHHIQRVMILGTLALLAGIDPWELTEWMWSGFVDGAEWVMLPNAIGMALHADGGRMATKPHAASGAYIDKMSDYCGSCAYERRLRVGPDACPFTTLCWAFLDRHRDRFERNTRVARQVHAGQRLGDLDEVNTRAAEVLVALDAGTL